MKDKKLFQQYMTGMGELFDKKISDALKDIYWTSLEPFTDEECKKAFDQVITSCKWFPKPAELLERLKGTEQDKATLAWIEVYEAIKEVGSGQSIRFPDPVIHSVVEAMGGWVRLAFQEEKDSKWNRKEFIDLYRVLSKKTSHPEYLVGEYEEINRWKGYKKLIELPIEWHGQKLIEDSKQ
jgi:hypothetical protein